MQKTELEHIKERLFSTKKPAEIMNNEIKNIFVDSEENLHFRIEDYYNFNPNRTSLKGRIGEKLQNNGFLKPYYIITVLKLPKKIRQSGI